MCLHWQGSDGCGIRLRTFLRCRDELVKPLPKLAESFPEDGKAPPKLAKPFPEAGEALPKLAEPFPEVGEAPPKLAACFPPGV